MVAARFSAAIIFLSVFAVTSATEKRRPEKLISRQQKSG
jgi:hypothetical protein